VPQHYTDNQQYSKSSRHSNYASKSEKLQSKHHSVVEKCPTITTQTQTSTSQSHRSNISSNSKQQQQQQSHSEKYQDGMALLQNGNEYFFSECYLAATGYYYQAARIFKDLPDSAKELSKAWSNVAECHLRLSNWQAAQDAATDAVHADPHNTKALYRRAKARFELGLYVGAAEDADAVGTQEAMDVAALCRDLAQVEMSKEISEREVQEREEVDEEFREEGQLSNDFQEEEERESYQRHDDVDDDPRTSSNRKSRYVNSCDSKENSEVPLEYISKTRSFAADQENQLQTSPSMEDYSSIEIVEQQSLQQRPKQRSNSMANREEAYYERQEAPSPQQYKQATSSQLTFMDHRDDQQYVQRESRPSHHYQYPPSMERREDVHYEEREAPPPDQPQVQKDTNQLLPYGQPQYPQYQHHHREKTGQQTFVSPEERDLWFRRIVDSYRLRVDDEYTQTGASDANCLYGIRSRGKTDLPTKHFQAYVQRALKKRVLPSWFTVSQIQGLSRLAMIDRFSNLMMAGVPEEISDFYAQEYGLTEEVELLRDLALFIEGPIGMPWRPDTIAMTHTQENGNQQVRNVQAPAPAAELSVTADQMVGSGSWANRRQSEQPAGSSPHPGRLSGTSQFAERISREDQGQKSNLIARAQSYEAFVREHKSSPPTVKDHGYDQQQANFSGKQSQPVHRHYEAQHSPIMGPSTIKQSSKGRRPPYVPIAVIEKVSLQPSSTRNNPHVNSSREGVPSATSISVVRRSEHLAYDTELRRGDSRTSRQSQQRQRSYERQQPQQQQPQQQQPQQLTSKINGSPKFILSDMVTHPKNSRDSLTTPMKNKVASSLMLSASPSSEMYVSDEMESKTSCSGTFGPKQDPRRQVDAPTTAAGGRLKGEALARAIGKSRYVSRTPESPPTSGKTNDLVLNSERITRNGLYHDERNEVFSELTELSP